MKIKKSVGKNVCVAVSNCREVIIRETINMLKQIGAEDGDDVVFGQTLFLHRSNGNTMETTVCDRISYSDRRGGHPFYIVSMDGDMCLSSIFLSIDNLLAIYKAVRKVVREE